MLPYKLILDTRSILTTLKRRVFVITGRTELDLEDSLMMLFAALRVQDNARQEAYAVIDEICQHMIDYSDAAALELGKTLIDLIDQLIEHLVVRGYYIDGVLPYEFLSLISDNSTILVREDVC